MPRISDIRRIVVEDFKQEDQDTVAKIAGSYNEFADEVIQVINGNIDFDNMTRTKVAVDITIDISGTILENLKVNTGLSYVSGMNIIKVDNAVGPSLRLPAAPYIHFTYLGSGVVSLDYAKGLASGTKYRVVLEFIA